MKTGRALVCMLIIVLTCPCQGFSAKINILNPPDILGTAENPTTGIISSVSDIVPTPEEIFKAGKQVVLGYPLEVIISAIHEMLSASLTTDVIKPMVTPDIQNMSILLIRPTKIYSKPLLEEAKLWNSFDKSKKTVILVTDLNDPIYQEAMREMANAPFCAGDPKFEMWCKIILR